MRVIAGKYKGRQLYSPNYPFIRPTTDIAKEAIFNIFSHIWQGANVLDLYAGTGSLGIEALSRGAKMAVFIDKNQRAIQTIKKNLLTFAIQQKVLTYKENILKGFSYLKDSFEVIFMDPPYEKGYVEKTLYLIDAKVRLLKKQGLIIIEHSAKENFSFIDFSLIVCRQYGQTMITFLRKE